MPYKVIDEQGKELLRQPRGMSFEVLGCRVQFNSRFEQEVINRKSRAWRTFGAMRALLENDKIKDKAKLSLFSMTVDKSYFWCAGPWNLMCKNVERARAIQLNFLRWIFYTDRRPNENIEDHVRSNRLYLRRLRQAGGAKWDEKYHGMRWACAGNAARFARFDTRRLTLRVLFFY
jgi:hypothetical protein